jgi:hypothetical protein
MYPHREMKNEHKILGDKSQGKICQFVLSEWLNRGRDALDVAHVNMLQNFG